ncbi:MAG: nitrous oxide reductase accessory protein NosL [Anaerolineaceae bacterium]|nr:MAG: nitrous oxide reductase accessory protein NosL [Anaerolineaceae bacterium]
MKHWAVLIFTTLALFLFVGCGQTTNLEEPPQIVYGQDVCERCSMIISEEKFAAAYWTAGGEARRFDDIGGMLAYNSEQSEDVASYWVHDFASGEWIRAEKAYLVLDGDLMTPMGFGIAAFADEEQADAMAYGQEDVMVMPFADLLAMNITMPDDLHTHEGHSE